MPLELRLKENQKHFSWWVSNGMFMPVSCQGKSLLKRGTTNCLSSVFVKILALRFQEFAGVHSLLVFLLQA